MNYIISVVGNTNLEGQTRTCARTLQEKNNCYNFFYRYLRSKPLMFEMKEGTKSMRYDMNRQAYFLKLFTRKY